MTKSEKERPSEVKVGQRWSDYRGDYSVVAGPRAGDGRFQIKYADGRIEWCLSQSMSRDAYLGTSEPTEAANPFVPVAVETGCAPPAKQPTALLCRLGLTCPKHYPKKVEPYIPTVSDWDLLPDAPLPSHPSRRAET